MDTGDVSTILGTTPRLLRAFLRSSHSTFAAVGSGARYDFTEREIPTLKRRFVEWQRDGKPRPSVATTKPQDKPKRRLRAVDKLTAQERRDLQVWAEEGPVEIPDIRNPRVRARALNDARAAEEKLMIQLMAAGLHITQLGDRKR